APSIAARADREIRLEHGRLASATVPQETELQSALVDLWRLLEEDGAPVSVTRRGVADLLASGLLAFVDGRIAFTDRGRARAAPVVRRAGRGGGARGGAL